VEGGEAYQIYAEPKASFGLILAYPRHSFFFIQTPDINLAIYAGAREVLAICTQCNRPYLTRLVLICDKVSPLWVTKTTLAAISKKA
jgi:hypothetical protein